MNRVARLVGTEAVAIQRFDHVGEVPHRDPERERAAGYAVSFVEAGSFRLRTNQNWRMVGVNSLFVATPGLEFSCAHDEEYPRDSCVSVRYAEQTVESARAIVTLTGRPVRRLTNRLAFLHRALAACAPGDEARVEALAGALLWSLSSGTSRHRLFRPDRLAWYAARVDRTKALIEARYAEPLSLSTMAREAGMSLFHFARIFAELEGRPPHRLLAAVRLEHALTRLRAGESVTDTCFAVGFGSLSHFVTTFRRRYGTTPSEIRRRSTT